jgi:hypothetical protein
MSDQPPGWHQQEAAPPLEENLHAPELFAGDAAFFTGGNGVVSITFVSYRWDQSAIPPVQKGVVVGRLVMPVAGAQHLALGLYDYLKSQDLIDPPLLGDPSRMQ